jgi:ParB/RepB/Spo0J family partition protein
MEQIQMVHVDVLHPHEQNPRIDAAQVEDLTESIREHGVEVPLVAAPEPDGTEGYVVLAGHRRLTAAHALGLAEVPVQVRDDLTDPKAQLAFMATENILRDQLTAVEEARLVQDMLDLGMTQAQVAKQTALGKQRVKDRAKLAKLASDTGEKVHRGQITVDDALVIAEYSDDPEAVEELEAAAGTYRFDWEVSAARRRREERARAAASRKEAKKLGLRVSEKGVGLTTLVEAGVWGTPAIEEAAEAGLHTGEEWVSLLTDEHAACPGHCGVIITDAGVRVPVLGAVPVGTLVIACDQQESLHPADGAADSTDPEPEPADPWDDLDADDFATAKIHRERHLAATLPDLDTADVAVKHLVAKLVKQGWTGYGDNQVSIDLLQALTGNEGKTKVTKALSTWPLSLLVWLEADWWGIKADHKYMGEGRQGSSYWGAKGTLRQLLERTGYQWTDVEQQAILLATGIPHAEGGEAA